MSAALARGLGDRVQDSLPGLSRLDDLVDDAKRDRARQAADDLLMLGGEPGPRPAWRSSAGAAASVRRCRMRTAATEPMTATSAPGQASTFVAPSAREFIAM